MGLMARIERAQNERNTAQPQRMDGYTGESPVFLFQAEIERGLQPDYSVLRAVLLWARENPSASLNDLHAQYIART